MKFMTVAAAAILAFSPLAANAGSVAAGTGEPVVAPADDDDVLAAGSLGSFGLGGGAAAAAAVLVLLAVAASSDDTTHAE